MSASISSTIPEIATRFRRGIPSQLLDAGVAHIAEDLREPFTEALIREEPERTGQLKDKTDALVMPLPGMAILDAHSEAENEAGQYYAYFVYTQHRIVAWGHDTGKKSVPNEFPQRALVAMQPQIETEVRAGMEETAMAVLRILA